MNSSLSTLLPGLSASDGDSPISPQTERGIPACPRCETSVLRVRRRLIDRLISAIYPVHRYRCNSIICDWEGNLPYSAPVLDRRDAVAADSASRAPASLVVSGRPLDIAQIDENATR